jgi:hypothetical protein
MAQVTYSFKIDTETDAGLVHWLEGRSNKSEAIREALREYVGRNSITLGDVLQAVRDLERKVKAGAVVHNEPEQAGDFDEPPDVAAALDALADL